MLEVLNKVEVHPGDVFFIQSGTIHAIGAGILICEIQQNSNCTYRVLRLRPPGRRRQAPPAAHRQGPGRVHPGALGHRQPPGAGALLRRGHRPKAGECAYFSTQKLRVEEALTLEAGEESFLSLVCVEAEGCCAGRRTSWNSRRGRACWCPRARGRCPCAVTGTVIQTTVPGQA